MMQSIASAQTDVAAFAATGEQTHSADLNSEFGQLFQQRAYEQSTKPRAEPKGANAPVGAAKDEPTQVNLKNTATNQPESRNVVDAASTRQQKRDSDEQVSQELTVAQNTSEDQQGLSVDEQKAEEWLDLVNQLQLFDSNQNSQPNEQINQEDILTTGTQSAFDEPGVQQDTGLEEDLPDEAELLALYTTLTKDNRSQALLDAAGITSIDDFKQKLSELSKGQTSEIATLMTDPSVNQMMAYLSKLGQNPGERKTAEVNADINQAEGIKAGLASFAQDVRQLLANNQLNPSEVELLQHALHATINNKQAINPDLVQLVQTKLNQLTKGEISSETQSNKAQVTEGSTEQLQVLLAKMTASEMSMGAKTELKTQIEIPVSELALNKKDGQVSGELAKVNLFVENTDSDLNVSSKQHLNPSLVNAEAENKSSANKAAVEADMKALIALPQETLDKALLTIAQRVAALLADDAKAQQKMTVLTQRGAETVIPSPGNQDLLAALKAGVSEFKQQLAAGREPGIDLAALVSQAMAKTSDSEVSAQAANNIEQSLLGLSQALSLASQLDESSQRRQMLSALDMNIDKLLTQSEQSKVLAGAQVESKFDKAINLAKPEAHQQLAEKVRWMVNTNNLIAEIRLDPAELGSMQVKVSMSADSASVNFVVQSQQTRDALDTATPRLREMLAEKGIELGQSTVRQDSQAKQDSQGQTQQQSKANQRLDAQNEGFSDTEAGIMSQTLNLRQAAGGIDYFV